MNDEDVNNKLELLERKLDSIEDKIVFINNERVKDIKMIFYVLTFIVVGICLIYLKVF